MGKLNIHTEKGQATLITENKTYDAYLNAYPELDIVSTDKDKPSSVDALLVRDGVVVGVVEQKSRNLSLAKLEEYDSLILTNDKLMNLQQVSSILLVPVYIMAYLKEDDKIAVWQVTDDNGAYRYNFEIKQTGTRKNINGGWAKRVNAFLPFDKIEEIIDANN